MTTVRFPDARDTPYYQRLLAGSDKSHSSRAAGGVHTRARTVVLSPVTQPQRLASGKGGPGIRRREGRRGR